MKHYEELERRLITLGRKLEGTDEYELCNKVLDTYEKLYDYVNDHYYESDEFDLTDKQYNSYLKRICAHESEFEQLNIAYTEVPECESDFCDVHESPTTTTKRPWTKTQKYVVHGLYAFLAVLLALLVHPIFLTGVLFHAYKIYKV